MKKKLFSQNISPDCSYCENGFIDDGVVYCKKRKKINRNKCRAFRYDPLLRVPKSSVFSTNFTMDDFRL